MNNKLTGQHPDIQFTDLARQQKNIRAGLEKRISKVLDHGKYIMGPEVISIEVAA